jgi:ABC-type Zn2+ transport system substrate-binding protein/surface adhesin
MFRKLENFVISSLPSLKIVEINEIPKVKEERKKGRKRERERKREKGRNKERKEERKKGRKRKKNHSELHLSSWIHEGASSTSTWLLEVGPNM